MATVGRAGAPSAPVQLPKGRGWVYFLVMAAAAAMFGGFVYWLLHAIDPLGRFRAAPWIVAALAAGVVLVWLRGRA